MASPPPLFVVSSALNAAFQALPHVLDLVTSFLIPLSIDSAVYNRLIRVIQVYETSRPYTVGAMDGAAATGELELIQWLHNNRNEGCSRAAFINAAVNRHLTVLEWLYEFYPEIANPAEEIVKAAECGHIEVITFLLPIVRREQVERALEAAAANGHVAVLEAVLQRPYSMRKSLLAAASRGQARVVQFLLDRGYSDRYAHVNPALMKAAEGGHCDVVELLINKSDDYTISEALMATASDGRLGVVVFLLGRWTLEKVAIARALEKAAEKNQCDVVKVLLDNLNCAGASIDTVVRPANSIIKLAFISAVEKGRISMVKLLIDSFSGPIGDALITAGSNCQVEVLEFILDFCEERHLKGTSFNQSATSIAETAASSRCIALAKLLVAKCAALNTGSALRIAVDNNDFEMLQILIVKSNVISIQDALVEAAVINRVEMLEALLEHSNADTIEQALIRVESAGNSTMSKLLLRKCDPIAYTRIFDTAAGHGLVGLVQLLLDKMTDPSIRCALISATIAGQTEVVKVLMKKSDSIGLTGAFEMAVVRGQLGIVELLRNQCDASGTAFALLVGDADVERLLRSKRARLE